MAVYTDLGVVTFTFSTTTESGLYDLGNAHRVQVENDGKLLYEAIGESLSGVLTAASELFNEIKEVN